jgi:hypothetical protein
VSTGWGGADPIEVVDGADYELGCEYLANVDITITHIRVWTGAGEVSVTDRRGRIWSTAGGQLGIAVLPDDLPDGWSSHALTSPVERLAGTRFVVSYSTGGNYGALTNGLSGAVDSGDTAVTAVAAASGGHGNGCFNTNPGNFPTTASGNFSFYGTDFVYSLGIGGNTAPSITEFTVTAVSALATATVVATDAETLVGATYGYDWGDGATATSASATAQHTYTASGLYAVLGSVTDADGAVGYAAAAVQVHVPDPTILGLDVAGLYDAMVSHALDLGIFESVNTHEPKSAPSLAGITASVILGPVTPRRTSGLNATSFRLEFLLRIQSSMLTEPQDDIDPDLLRATSTVLAEYSSDFTLGGLVRAIDLLGSAGAGMSATPGYLNQDGKLYRVVDVSLPLLADDVVAQQP